MGLVHCVLGSEGDQASPEREGEGQVRTKDVFRNHGEEHIESQTPMASIIWFYQGDRDA